jgi:hypothetical protein
VTGHARRALVGLLLYVGIGLVSPVVDAQLSHRGPPDRAHHVEAPGAPGCHHPDCVLDAPGAPQAPARPPSMLAAAFAPRLVAPSPALVTQHHDRTPARVFGPRAPPHLT